MSGFNAIGSVPSNYEITIQFVTGNGPQKVKCTIRKLDKIDVVTISVTDIIGEMAHDMLIGLAIKLAIEKASINRYGEING